MYVKPYGTLSITSTDATNKRYTENMGLIKADDLITDSATQLTLATQIDEFARKLIALSTNTYDNSEVTMKFNVAEMVFPD